MVGLGVRIEIEDKCIPYTGLKKQFTVCLGKGKVVV